MAAAGRQDWRTPPEVLDLVRAALRGRIDLDPCASREALGAGGLIGEQRNIFGPPDASGLEEPWAGRVYVNPPFDGLAEWATKCRREHEEHGAEVILLLPARTDTAYWHEHVSTAKAVCFWRGRMRFVGASASAPFPTALAYWGAWPWAFHEAMRSKGMVVAP
jgi:hypothetical protein